MMKFLNQIKKAKKISSLGYSFLYPFSNSLGFLEEEINLENFPEKRLFSSLIEYDKPDPKKSAFIEKESKLVLNSNVSLTENKLISKTSDFQLKKKDYLGFMNDNPNGRVNIFNYKETKMTLVGAQYEFLPIKNIYQILSFSKPDIVLLQVKPDQIINNFKILLKKEKTHKFSSVKYFSQCFRTPFEIMPNNEYRQKIVKHLEENKIYISDKPSNNSEKEKIFKQYQIKDRISMDAIATACFYCELNKTPLVLCDVPELVFRQDFVNNKTLMQLQNIFTRCSRDLAFFPDYQPQTPMNMGYYTYPELFLEKSDKYIATMIEYLLRPKGYKGKHILGLLGYMQSDSVAVYLNNRKTSHFDFELTSSQPEGNFIRDITGEEVLEKHTIMDVMHYGIDVLEKLDDLEFNTTKKIIERYSDPFKVNSGKVKEFKMLHYEFLKKYQHFACSEFEEGEKLLKREFLKQHRII